MSVVDSVVRLDVVSVMFVDGGVVSESSVALEGSVASSARGSSGGREACVVGSVDDVADGIGG